MSVEVPAQDPLYLAGSRSAAMQGRLPVHIDWGRFACAQRYTQGSLPNGQDIQGHGVQHTAKDPRSDLCNAVPILRSKHWRMRVVQADRQIPISFCGTMVEIGQEMGSKVGVEDRI